MARARLAPLLVAIVGALYLGLTCARDLQPFDSTEFALNATQLGVGHPPGQPLYLVLSALVVRAPGFLSPSHALVWLSIAATLLGAAGAVRFGLASSSEPGSSSGSTLALGVATGLGALLLPGVWDLGTRAEVYPLAALCLGGALFVALQHEPAATQHAPAATQHRRLALVGLLLGLGASVNPAMAVAAGVGLAPRLAMRLAAAGWPGGLTGGALLVGGGLLGLVPYALLPLAGAHPRDALVWGEPLSGDALAFFVAGRDYRAWQVGGAELASNLGAAAGWLLAEGLLPWILLGSVGLALGPLPRSAKLALPLGATAAAGLLSLNHPFLPDNPDYDGYLLPWVWLSLGGVVQLCVALARRTPRAPALSLLAVAGLVLAGLLAGPPFASRTRARSRLVRELAERALAATPERGLLVVESDHLVFGTLYLHEVEGVRPDVMVINAGWLNSSWYLRHLARRYPEAPRPRLDVDPGTRLALLCRDAARPVAAETARLARRCGLPATDVTPPPAELLRLADAHALAGSLDERLLALTAVRRVDADPGDPASWPALRAALRPTLRALLPEAPPPPILPGPPPPLTRFTVPRTLLPPEALLVRLGDLLASSPSRATAGEANRQAARALYQRADLPESEAAIARLLDEKPPRVEGRSGPADVAPRGD